MMASQMREHRIELVRLSAMVVALVSELAESVGANYFF